MGAVYHGNEERNAEIIRRRRAGEWPSEIRAAMGLSRNVVAGVLDRAGLTDPNVDKTLTPSNSRKLTRDQVQQIRALYRKGVRGFGYCALAKRFGVSFISVYQIIQGQTHKFREAA